jgi:hypothetical protein
MEAFLSYGNANAEVASKLAAELKKQGIETWFDRQIQLGDRWVTHIEDAIREAPTVLVLIGKDEQPGPYRRAEWRMALEAVWQNPSKRLIPVLLPGALLPTFRGHRQWHRRVPGDPDS